MDSEEYFLLDDDPPRSRGNGAPPQSTAYQMLQPRFAEPARPVPKRDRYRTVSQFEDVEDADPDMELDSFDQELLRRPYPDRRYQAEVGRGRLSFAPGRGGREIPRVLQSERVVRDEYPRQRQIQNDEESGEAVYLEQSFRDQIRKFRHNEPEAQESSSDAQTGYQSSPAFRAAQARADYHARQAIQKELYTQPSWVDQGHTDLPEMDEAAPEFDMYEDARREDLEDVCGYEATNPVERPTDLHNNRTIDPTNKRLSTALPVCQGIQLVAVSTLPNRLATVFPYPAFNAIQSKCFDRVFNSNDNFVLASPTGSGKTVVLELAICRAVANFATDQYKVVYLAPTKALCAERQRDWQKKFTHLSLKCVELTGDSDFADIKIVQSANIIITTPEKWDSITRKWRDHEKLMRLVRLFLVDEVHLLKEDRGAVLEAIVSRMKTIGTDVRFVALSATVPNFHDVAAWLGKNTTDPRVPASHEKFGEEFRPVKLQKHVCGYTAQTNNDFSFDKVLDKKLPDVIARYSEHKPLMVFCATRTSCVSTAKIIAKWWGSQDTSERMWHRPSKQVPVLNKDLREIIATGVSFHHAGLDIDDRTQVEKSFLNREISVICCTSTLAVGVNLPCHLVIIKNTMNYTNEGLQEYSDLEMMQMLGRAGRPQHDDSAVAVIMTRQTKVGRYEKMVTGQEMLESKLHLNLIGHLNAEIGLGTIRDLPSARNWLKGTFLYVRLQQNPSHYKLEGVRNGQGLDQQLDEIFSRDISLLCDHNLVSNDDYLRCTDFGHAMARYYVHFNTMKVFMGLPKKASLSEILSAIAQASEFDQVRFRAGEKPLYKHLNKSPSIRFGIPVNLDLPAHKVSLIIQSVLGAADIVWDGDFSKHKSQYSAETQIIFKNVNSLVRCIIDCQISAADSFSIHNALMLERSLGSRSWDDTPLQIKQIEGIGRIAVRKLVNAGIRCIEDLEGCDAQRIETLIGRNPPFGMKILELVAAFPKPRISLHMLPGSYKRVPDGVEIQVKADVGFMNQKIPQRFNSKAIYVCVLAETSDGRKIHFARIRGQKLASGQTLLFPVLLTSRDQSINCYVMCDSIAGSMRSATVKPQLPASMFTMKPPELNVIQQSNTSKRRTESGNPLRKPSTPSDDFGDGDIDDDALVKASFCDLGFDHIDNFANPADAVTRKNTAKNKGAKASTQSKVIQTWDGDNEQEPTKLPNGKWACNHKCKDKDACKHLCCKEGMDKLPKKASGSRNKILSEAQDQSSSSQKPKTTQSKLQLTSSKRKVSQAIEELDLTQQEHKRKSNLAKSGPKDYRELHHLHKTIQKTDTPSTLHSVMRKKPGYCYSLGGEYSLSFMGDGTTQASEASSDYGDLQFDEMTCHTQQPSICTDSGRGFRNATAAEKQGFTSLTADITRASSDAFGDEDSLLGDAMVGLVDSQNLQDTSKLFETSDHVDVEPDYALDVSAYEVDGFASSDKDNDNVPNEDEPWAKDAKCQQAEHAKSNERTGPFLFATSSPRADDPRSTDPVRTSQQFRLMEQVLPQDTQEHSVNKDNTTPTSLDGLESWFMEEFGDVVQLVD